MSNNVFIRFEKTNGDTGLKRSAAYVLREGKGDGKGRNTHLSGPDTSAGVVELARKLLLENGVIAPIKRRGTHEYVSSISTVISPGNKVHDELQFFRDCTEWAGCKLGVVLLSAIHRDSESERPHVHILTAPPVDGGIPKGSDFLSKRNLQDHLRDFSVKVASQYGLNLMSHSKADPRDIIDKYLGTPEGVRKIEEKIKQNPDGFLRWMNKKSKSFSQIMTGSGKGAKTLEEEARRDRSPTYQDRAAETWCCCICYARLG